MHFQDEYIDLYNDTIHDLKVASRFITDTGFLFESAFYEFDTYVALTIPPEAGIINKRLLSEEVLHYCPYTEITQLTLPDPIRRIDDESFNGFHSLRIAFLPDSLTYIGDGAFNDCIALRSLSLPPLLTHLGNRAFRNCICIKSLSIPDSIEHIGSSAFEGCAELEQIIIPDSITHLEKNTFKGCTSLKSILLPDSLTWIGESTFEGCAALQTISIPPSVTYIGDNAFKDCASLQSIILPPSLTHLGCAAFKGCIALQSISIPDSLDHIEEDVFFQCRTLKYFSLPRHLLARIFSLLHGVKPKAVCCPVPPEETFYPKPFVIGFALNEFAYPQDIRRRYIEFIRLHLRELIRDAISFPKLLTLMCREKLITASHIDALLDETRRRKEPELTALLLEHKHMYLTPAADDSADAPMPD